MKGRDGLAALIGAILTGLPLFTFMESRIEKRVKQEVTVATMKATDKERNERLKTMEGRVWTNEQDIKGLRELLHAK